MIVEFFSAEIVLRVWRYRSCNADGDSDITSEASFKERAASLSPFAAITCKIGRLVQWGTTFFNSRFIVSLFWQNWKFFYGQHLT